MYACKVVKSSVSTGARSGSFFVQPYFFYCFEHQQTSINVIIISGKSSMKQKLCSQLVHQAVPNVVKAHSLPYELENVSSSRTTG